MNNGINSLFTSLSTRKQICIMQQERFSLWYLDGSQTNVMHLTKYVGRNHVRVRSHNSFGILTWRRTFPTMHASFVSNERAINEEDEKLQFMFSFRAWLKEVWVPCALTSIQHEARGFSGFSRFLFIYYYRHILPPRFHGAIHPTRGMAPLTFQMRLNEGIRLYKFLDARQPNEQFARKKG